MNLLRYFEISVHSLQRWKCVSVRGSKHTHKHKFTLNRILRGNYNWETKTTKPLLIFLELVWFCVGANTQQVGTKSPRLFERKLVRMKGEKSRKRSAGRTERGEEMTASTAASKQGRPRRRRGQRPSRGEKERVALRLHLALRCKATCGKAAGLMTQRPRCRCLK